MQHTLFTRRKNRAWLLLIVGVVIVIFLVAYKTTTVVKINFFQNLVAHPDNQQMTINSQHDFSFLLINTTNCKIPDFLPWTPTTRTLLEKKCQGFPYYYGEPKCSEQHHHHVWSYIRDEHLHINLSAVNEAGYSWNSIRCCYRVIIRGEQSPGFIDKRADWLVKYSDECYPVKQPVQHIDTDFIRLFCISTSVPLVNDAVTRDFLAGARADDKAKQKMKKWADRRATGYENKIKGRNETDFFLPPNVVIIGLDTMSRLNARRTMPKTISLLQSIEAIEMKGYMKVGYNTFPNTAAFLGGHTAGEFRNICYKNGAVTMEECPLIWWAYEKVGYLTALVEDTIVSGAFNFKDDGFARKPTDFYFRPFMVALWKYMPRLKRFDLRCLGKQQIEKVFLDYLEDVMRMSASSGTPLFADMWLSFLVHDCSLNAQYADQLFAEYLLKFTSGNNSNTILIFMGDHGETHGYLRGTLQGWYEDKLPMSWIYIPPSIRQKFPDWQSSLEENSNRLTSHFDMYQTLVHILQTFDHDNVAQETYEKATAQRGQSLLKIVDEKRRCSLVGVPDGYCACSPPSDLSVSDERVAKATIVALDYISKMLPEKVCAFPTLSEIKRANYFESMDDNGVYFDVFVINFVTEPGQFLFEATLRQPVKPDEKGQREMTLATDVIRVSSMTRRVDCVDEAQLQKYCHCN